MPDRAHGSGAYTADRAAALAGIPVSTLYYWARTELVVPSVSKSKLKRWSYADLLVLRLIDWLRHDKPPELAIEPTSVRRIRQTLERVESFGERLLEHGFEVYVDRGGNLVFEEFGGLVAPVAKGAVQQLFDLKVDLVKPFEVYEGLRGPDLVRPRPTLRIVPGKLSGEPHVEATRVPTNMLAALGRRGFDPAAIAEMYPPITAENVSQALDLEVQLENNLRRRPAA
jgi:uncharacterized protein (DUF433 family)